MPRFSMNEMTTYRWSFEEDIVNYRAANIPAVGVWRQKLSDFGEDKGIDLLAQHGLKVSNLMWAGGFTGNDGHTFRESLADAQEAIQLAAALKAGCLVVYSGARAGHTHNHARRLLTDALRHLIPLAADLRVTLAIEPMHPACATDWTFLTSLDDALAVVRAAESPRVKLAFDTYHWGCDAVVERIGELAPHIAIVHLADGRHPPVEEQQRMRLGEGAVPLEKIISALNAAGYDGDYDVELIGEEIELTDYCQLLEHSMAAYTRLMSRG